MVENLNLSLWFSLLLGSISQHSAKVTKKGFRLNHIDVLELPTKNLDKGDENLNLNVTTRQTFQIFICRRKKFWKPCFN